MTKTPLLIDGEIINWCLILWLWWYVGLSLWWPMGAWAAATAVNFAWLRFLRWRHAVMTGGSSGRRPRGGSGRGSCC